MNGALSEQSEQPTTGPQRALHPYTRQQIRVVAADERHTFVKYRLSCFIVGGGHPKFFHYPRIVRFPFWWIQNQLLFVSLMLNLLKLHIYTQVIISSVSESEKCVLVIALTGWAAAETVQKAPVNVSITMHSITLYRW